MTCPYCLTPAPYVGAILCRCCWCELPVLCQRCMEREATEVLPTRERVCMECAEEEAEYLEEKGTDQ